MLAQKKENAFSPDEAKDAMRSVPLWTLRDHSIVREFGFKDFRQAMEFVNRVASVAEAQDHHPDIFISYDKVKLELSTHTSGGLTNKDFEVAAKVDLLA